MLTKSQLTFRERTIDLAKKFAPQYGLDWRLMAATAILESGWGQSHLARRAHNLFGIKAGPSTPPEKVCVLKSSDGESRFRKYESDEHSFHAYGQLVGRSNLYARARRMAREAALKYFIANLAPVYCPDDPDYRLKITQIIEMLE